LSAASSVVLTIGGTVFKKLQIDSKSPKVMFWNTSHGIGQASGIGGASSM
jgi:hypothetical protein